MATKEFKSNNAGGNKNKKASDIGKTAAAAAAGIAGGVATSSLFGNDDSPATQQTANETDTVQNTPETQEQTSDPNQVEENPQTQQEQAQQPEHTEQSTIQETPNPTINTTVHVHTTGPSLPDQHHGEGGSVTNHKPPVRDPEFDYSQVDEGEQINESIIQVVSGHQVVMVNGEEVPGVEVVLPTGEHAYLVDLDGDGMYNNLASLDGRQMTVDGSEQLLGHYTMGDLELMHDDHRGNYIDGPGYVNSEIASHEHGEGTGAMADFVNTTGSQVQEEIAQNNVSEEDNPFDDDDDPTPAPGESDDDSRGMGLIIDGWDDGEAENPIAPGELLSDEDVYAQLFGDDVNDNAEYGYDDVIISEELEKTQPTQEVSDVIAPEEIGSEMSGLDEIATGQDDSPETTDVFDESGEDSGYDQTASTDTTPEYTYSEVSEDYASQGTEEAYSSEDEFAYDPVYDGLVAEDTSYNEELAAELQSVDDFQMEDSSDA